MTQEERKQQIVKALVPLIRAELERQQAEGQPWVASYTSGVVGDPPGEGFCIDGDVDLHKVAEVVAGWHIDAVSWIENPGMNGR